MNSKIILKTLILILFIFFFKTTQAADIDASASRTSGVAPLAIHFNADLTASSETERSFHDYEYSWNFDDPTSGNWGTSGKSKNTDKGPVAAHIYETPGTYIATLTVKDQTGTIIDSENFTITVDDPEIVFAGTKTTCISTGTDFAGCPIGATQVVTSNLDGIASYIGSERRILLQRGGSFIASTPLSLGDSTTFHLGAFGNCFSPDFQGICDNAPHITFSTGTNVFIDLANKNDWRITDLHLSGEKSGGGIVGGAINIRRFLFFKNYSEGFNTAVGWSHWRLSDDSKVEENSVVDNKMQNMGSTGIFIGADRLSFLGNSVHNSDTTHVVRVWWAHLGVISHNQISGSSLNNTSGRAALKLHGPLTGSYSWGACWPYEGQGFI
ncbi:MAG: PKD domain-containing protein, partial [Candidatus Moraniibacteriota bacterium]